MKVTLIQMDIAWENPEENRRRAQELMLSAPRSDLYVLPEMFTTGFAVHKGGALEPHDGDTHRWMKEMAQRLDAAITGSVAVVTEDGDSRNRMYFVKPDGSIRYYDKRHLFTYGGEDKLYTQGTEKTIVEWRGVRFMLQVCYDLRFPVFVRNTMRSGEDGAERKPQYDCCIYVANWPDSRRRVWNVLTRARAIENQCFVLAANRVGDDPICHYDGGSVVVDAYGKDVAAATDNQQMTITAELDMEWLEKFRKKFPVLADGD